MKIKNSITLILISLLLISCTYKKEKSIIIYNPQSTNAESFSSSIANATFTDSKIGYIEEKISFNCTDNYLTPNKIFDYISDYSIAYCNDYIGQYVNITDNSYVDIEYNYIGIKMDTLHKKILNEETENYDYKLSYLLKKDYTNLLSGTPYSLLNYDSPCFEKNKLVANVCEYAQEECYFKMDLRINDYIDFSDYSLKMYSLNITVKYNFNNVNSLLASHYENPKEITSWYGNVPTSSIVAYLK